MKGFVGRGAVSVSPMANGAIQPVRIHKVTNMCHANTIPSAMNAGNVLDHVQSESDPQFQSESKSSQLCWNKKQVKEIEIGKWKSKKEIGNWKLENGNWKIEIEKWKLKNGTWKRKLPIEMYYDLYFSKSNA